MKKTSKKNWIKCDTTRVCGQQAVRKRYFATGARVFGWLSCLSLLFSLRRVIAFRLLLSVWVKVNIICILPGALSRRCWLVMSVTFILFRNNGQGSSEIRNIIEPLAFLLLYVCMYIWQQQPTPLPYFAHRTYVHNRKERGAPPHRRTVHMRDGIDWLAFFTSSPQLTLVHQNTPKYSKIYNIKI